MALKVAFRRKCKATPVKLCIKLSSLFPVVTLGFDENGKKEEIVEPTLANFKKRIAEEYMSLHGPRKFMAEIYRVQRHGEWSAFDKQTRKDGKPFKRWRLEHELKTLKEMLPLCENKRRVSFHFFGLTTVEDMKARIAALENKLPPNEENLDDKEIGKLALEFIQRLSEDSVLQQPDK